MTAPMYGFSALIEPINIAMGAENPTNGLPGALSGSLILLASGAAAVFFGKLMKVFGGRTPFFVFLNVIMCVGFVLGALACHWQLYWLLIVGFALPVGFACANIFMICVSSCFHGAANMDMPDCLPACMACSLDCGAPLQFRRPDPV